MDLLISFFFCSQFRIIQPIAHSPVLMSFTDLSFTDEQLDGFFNVVSNSSEAVIGGSCGTGGFLVICILIYLLYRLLKDDLIVHPKTEHDPLATNATNTNQNGASCSHCGPPMVECADPCICMSKSSTY